MSWTKDGPDAKFKAGDAVLYSAGAIGKRIATIVGVGEYHTEYRDRSYLGRFSDNTIGTVWENETTLATMPQVNAGQGRGQWQTQSLWGKYEQVIAKSKSVERWLENERKQLETFLSNATAPGLWPIGVVVFVLSVVALIITAAVTFGGKNPSQQWPWIGWFFVASGIGGLATWIRLGVPASATFREAKRKERMQDPLWQRAELILKTVKEFTVHRDHYRAWQTAVDEGLQDGDHALADRYHTFLTRVSIGIDASINNFTRAAELTARQMVYREKHPELAEEAASTHLSDLMAQLNCPVEIPAAISLMDPRSALEHEEALGEAVGQLYEGELMRQIDEALQEKGERLPSVPAEP